MRIHGTTIGHSTDEKKKSNGENKVEQVLHKNPSSASSINAGNTLNDILATA
jgi:hypothetical protein